ncbi:MAG: flagellar hook-length control protein FliK [Candidatus Gastranaerophilales bacterium]|nr:flagellar hook-length control protein FliK [Candidatus Gastranaerophilales bacterium]
MTNALAQNIQTNENTAAIDMIMQVVNTPSSSKSSEEQGFSNLINNLESKTQKAQSDFDKQAKVTNVSSINKKALNKKEAVSKNTDKNLQDTANVSKNVAQKNSEKATTNNSKEIKISDTKNARKEENQKIQNNNQETLNKVATKKQKETENLSDINNSSPVESSPVFSSVEEVALSEETKTEIKNVLEEIELNVEQLINSIPVVSEDIKAEIKDLSALLENVENLEDISEIVNKIETISSNFDNSTLNQEQKTEITKTLDEIKLILKDIKEVTEKPVEFENLMVELKEKISQLIKSANTDTKGETNLSSKSEAENKTMQPEKEIKFDIESLKEATNEIKEIAKEIKEAISNLDVKKINEFSEKISKTLEKLESTNDIQEATKEIDIKKDLIETLKNLKNLLEKNVETTEVEVKQEFVDLNLNDENKILETLDKLSSEDLKNIDLKDEKTIKEIASLLDNLNKEIENQEFNKEIKTEIEELIQKVSQKEISTDDLAQAIDALADDIKVESQKPQTESLEIESTLDTSKETTKIQVDLNQDTNQKQNQQDIKTNKTQEPEIDLGDLLQNDIDFNEVKLQANISKDIKVENNDIKNVEQNLQKTIAINEMLDEMMVEVDIKTIPSQSGALSVADEITKLAMGETNSLNSISSTNGSVTYDAVGVNALIKNVANLAKTTQTQNLNTPSMEDVLNQVANKVTQLKDANAQKLTMVLRPNDLGRLQIELTSNQQGLTTQIMAQNEDVRAYIERNIDSLRQQLSDAGVNVNSIQIKTAGSENSTTYDGNQNLNRDFEQENQNQQNKDEKNNQQNNNKEAKEVLTSISNYDMSFAKDFSSILNKSLSYGN